MNFASQVIQYVFTGLTLGSIYALVALGFTMIYNST
jgi:branched-chain amino acid transport system permease protein